MRTAVCVSGQPRFFEESYKSIYENIIAPNNADVFMHVWSYENYPDEPHKFGGDGGWKSHRISKDAHQKAIDLYKPLVYKIEPAKKIRVDCPALVHTFSKFKSSIPNEALEANLNIEQYSAKIFGDGHSMWYGIMMSNMLANVHSMESGFVYDMVVRVRFDVHIQRKLELLNFNSDYVYYEEMGQPKGLVSDWINFGSQRNMSVYCSSFNTMQKSAKDYLENPQLQNLPFCNELIGAVNLARNGIQPIGINMGLSLPRL